MKKSLLLSIGIITTCSLSYLAAVIFTYPKKWEHPQALNGPRKSSYPFIAGDTFRAACTFAIDEMRVPFDTSKVKDGNTIFLNADCLEFFFTQVHPHIHARYILVTHNSDCTVPGRFASYLDSPNLIAWFGQNGASAHPKFFHIPIGIANRYWPHGDIKVVEAVMSSAATSERTILLYLNQTDRTNTKERSGVRAYFKNKPFCHIAHRKPFKDYLTDLTHVKFIVCPPGNGLDCHRQWEALLMGATPVMLHGPLDSLMDDLALFVHDWSEVTEELLTKEWELRKNRTRYDERMFAGYWLGKIKELAPHVP